MISLGRLHATELRILVYLSAVPPLLRGVAVGAHEYDSQYMLSLYTRMVLISSIYHVFMVVAPLTTLFAWLYFLPAYPLHAQILLHVLGRPEVDTAGAVWEQAVRYQTVGLLSRLYTSY